MLMVESSSGGELEDRSNSRNEVGASPKEATERGGMEDKEKNVTFHDCTSIVALYRSIRRCSGLWCNRESSGGRRRWGGKGGRTEI